MIWRSVLRNIPGLRLRGADASPGLISELIVENFLIAELITWAGDR
jgi:hypothetical protein